jgi:hypothetical protein
MVVENINENLQPKRSRTNQREYEIEASTVRGQF